RGWRQEGIEEGRELGIAEGESKKAVEDARNMLNLKVGTPAQISQITGLSMEQVLELQKELAAEPAPAN
ncbi:MAG: hypothetical protein J6X95_01505, partial [Treponema sp.]|nr:hypothetical protein [Treponema sp.]